MWNEPGAFDLFSSQPGLGICIGSHLHWDHHLITSFFPPSGNYAVELVNDSLYDWNVKLLK